MGFIASSYPPAHEIVETFMTSSRSPTQAQLDTLAARHIPLWALAGAPDSGELGVRFGHIERHATAPSFEFTTIGEHVMLVAAIDAMGEIYDVVAAGRGGWLGSWLGRCAVLGIINAVGPRIMSDAVPIHSDMTGWLQGERLGLLIVNHSRAAMELLGLGPFIAENPEHGASLLQMLTISPPRIMIPKSTTTARAAA